MRKKYAAIWAFAMLFVLATTITVGQVVAFEDSDQDGLPDSWEMEYFGNLDHGPDEDYDGDGYTNLEEYEAGTSPVDPDDKPRPPVMRS